MGQGGKGERRPVLGLLAPDAIGLRALVLSRVKRESSRKTQRLRFGCQPVASVNVVSDQRNTQFLEP